MNHNTRIFVNFVIAVVLYAVMGLLLWVTVESVRQREYGYVIVALFVCYPVFIVSKALLAPVLRSASMRSRVSLKSASPRMHVFSSVVSKIVLDYRLPKQAHAVVTVKLEDDTVVRVNLVDLWQHLLSESRSRRKNILSWDKCVVKGGMDGRTWESYRKVLIAAECVDQLKTNELRLKYEPWIAVERVYVHFSWIAKARYFFSSHSLTQNNSNQLK